MSKEVTMLFKHFSKVLNEELKSHGIKARDFMGSCRIGHDRYGKVKKVRTRA